MKKHFILLLFLSCIAVTGAWAQFPVTDANGDALIGVNITEIGDPTTGTVTHLDGNYTFQVSSANVPLEFSDTGYTSKDYHSRANNMEESLFYTPAPTLPAQSMIFLDFLIFVPSFWE